MKFRSSRFIAFPAFFIAMVSIAVLPSGCEWESSGDDSTWDDSVSWANFSGLYRSGTASAALVSDFSLASGTTGTSSDSDSVEYPFTGVAGPIIAAPFATASGVLDFTNRGTAGWSLKIGSVSLTITGTVTGPVGAFTDNGAGGLIGTYAQVPGSTPIAATGTINYDTGAWSLALAPALPFIEPGQVTYSYVVQQETGGGGASPSYGGVYTLQVEQTGNQLQFTDNRGFVWSGTISAMTTPGGDTTGSTAGAVVGTFAVTGSSDSRFTITGTFTGNYIVSAEAGTAQLRSRAIQGIWMEPTGNGDLYGETTDGASTTVSIGTTN